MRKQYILLDLRYTSLAVVFAVSSWIGRFSDWDFTTNATPEQIQGLFDHTVYENTFGTVGVVLDDVSDGDHMVVEVTPYRKENGIQR